MKVTLSITGPKAELLVLDQIVDLPGRDAARDERTFQRLLGCEVREKGGQPRR